MTAAWIVEGPGAAKLLARLIEPRPSVVGFEARRRARYTALSIVVILPLGLVALLLTILAPPTHSPTVFRVEVAIMAATIALLAALHPVSRRRGFAWASYGAIGATSLAVWAPGLLDFEDGSSVTLYFLVLPIFMASLLVSSRGALVVAAGNVSCAFLLIPLLVVPDGASVSAALTLPLFLVAAAGLSVNAASLREKDLDALESLARKLEKQESDRVQMLHQIAHDLGSPLTPLKLQVQLIPADKAVAPERVEMLRRNLAQVERLVTDIKELARVEGGSFRFEAKPAELGLLARAAVDAFAPDAKAKGIALELALEGELPVVVDAQRTTQVFYNLLTNAIKFTPEGGRILVTCARVANEARVSVADSGRGLAPEEMARLFQPFVQVHERSEVKERGTGLGLYISRGIATAQRGRLWVESEGRGKGSTFTLALPLSSVA